MHAPRLATLPAAAALAASLPAPPDAAPAAGLLPWIGPGPSMLQCRSRPTEPSCGTKLYCILFPAVLHATPWFPHRDAAACLAARAPPPRPRVVFRGDARAPAELRRLRGIPPKAHGPRGNESFSLQAHHEDARRFADAYVSTSAAFGCALGYARAGYVYRLHATPNMVDLDASAVRLRFSSEDEFAALGGVRWDQVEAWMPVAGPDDVTEELVHAFREPDAFLASYPGHAWVANAEYNASRYDGLTAGPAEPRLAGTAAAAAEHASRTLEQWAADFMDRHGAAVGWAGAFPLDEPLAPAWGRSNATRPPAGFPLGSPPRPEVRHVIRHDDDEGEDPEPDPRHMVGGLAGPGGTVTPKRA